MLSRNVLCHGAEEGPGERFELRAGPLRMVFEKQTAFLRYVRLGDREILRGIYAAVRDANWDTIEPVLEDVQLEEGGDAFRLRFVARCRGRGVDFGWQGLVEGDARGRLSFSMAGAAGAEFRRNRIGFCVLHPACCAGLPCRVEKVDGTVEQGVFPEAISPHQPFADMRAIAHQVAPGLWARVAFAGDVFEMEDQRNWTDASYKTYCTPLSRPFPVVVEKGERVRQRVVLEIEGPMPGKGDGGRGELVFALQGGEGVPLMRLGLGAAAHGEPLTGRERERLRALHLAHLRVDLRLGAADWGEGLVRSWEEAEALGAALELALFVTDAAADELRALAFALVEQQPRIARFLVFHEREKSTSAQWVELARKHLGDLGAPIGAGTNAYFTELNRERPPVAALDCVCYSLNPQVHAFDDASLVETLAAQALTAESARRFCGDKALCVTPVTLKARFNPNATGPENGPEAGALPAQVDARQLSLFGAGWTLGSVKYLAESGLESATYYETSGWRGVLEREEGSPLPERFPSLPGSVFPLYHVLADVGQFGGRVRRSRSSDSLRVEGLVLEREGQQRLLLANLTGEAQRVRLQGFALQEARIRFLDERTAEEAMRRPEHFRERTGDAFAGEVVELMPFAVALLDAKASAGQP